MMQWSKDKSFEWYKNNEWIVGCNYLPSNAINQLEMFQSDTYDAEMNLRELTWAKELGFILLGFICMICSGRIQ